MAGLLSNIQKALGRGTPAANQALQTSVAGNPGQDPNLNSKGEWDRKGKSSVMCFVCRGAKEINGQACTACGGTGNQTDGPVPPPKDDQARAGYSRTRQTLVAPPVNPRDKKPQSRANPNGRVSL